MLNFLAYVDLGLTNLIISVIPHNQLLNLFFSFFSLRGSSIFIWIIVIVVILVLEERKYPGIQKKDIKFLIIFILSFSLSFITSDYLLKNLIKRPRPSHPSNLTLTYEVKGRLAQCPKDYSLPSSHATTAFASATILTFFDKKRKWFYYALAVLISLSRIHLGCHYFFDVIVGCIVGWTISKGIIFQLRRI